MNSSESAILRDSIESVERKGDKKVKVTCVNNSAGNEVNNIIQHNFASLSGGGALKLVNLGFTAKDFTIKTDSSESADRLADNLNAIMNNEAGDPVYETTDTEKKSSSMTLLIVAVLIFLIAIGIVLWKRK